MRAADIWRCPTTGAPLAWVDGAVLAILNDRIDDGGLRMLSGVELEQPLDGALATADRAYVYPSVDGVIMLLEASAIRLDDNARPTVRKIIESKQAVRAFYEEFGWTKSDEGLYADTVLFEDLRPVSAHYNRLTRLRVNDHLDRVGTYLLDIASGAIPFDEYATYSEGYEWRICCDFSLRALHEARSRLGDHGIYVQCDITRIPLRDDTVDGFVSLHTIYHVEAQEQAAAFAELVRVLRPGRRGVVVYTWAFPSLLMAPFHPVGLAKRMIKRWLPASVVQSLRRARGSASHGGADEAQSGLYFHPYGYSWYRQNLRDRYGARLACWRSIGLSFQTRFVRERCGGAKILALLARLETAFPSAMGRIGQYPMFIFEK